MSNEFRSIDELECDTSDNLTSELARVLFSNVILSQDELDYCKDLILVGAYTHKMAFGEKRSSALHHCSKVGYHDLINIILNNSQLIDDLDPELGTPLHVAATYLNYSTASALLGGGANPNILNAAGYNALHIIASPNINGILDNKLRFECIGDLSVLLDIQCSFANMLIDFGIDKDQLNHRNQSPLTLAIDYGYNKLALLLINRGASVNYLDSIKSQSPLHMAVYRNMYDVIECILNNGGNPDIENSIGITPLHIAQFEEHHAIVDILKSNGAKKPLPSLNHPMNIST